MATNVEAVRHLVYRVAAGLDQKSKDRYKLCSMAKTFAAIDVGTSKVCSVIANLGDEDALQILGAGSAPSGGVHKGLVVNIEEAKEAI